MNEALRPSRQGQIFEPSSGGIGMRLKTASMTLMYTVIINSTWAYLIASAARSPRAKVCRVTCSRARARAANVRFAAGPARLVSR